MTDKKLHFPSMDDPSSDLFIENEDGEYERFIPDDLDDDLDDWDLNDETDDGETGDGEKAAYDRAMELTAGEDDFQYFPRDGGEESNQRGDRDSSTDRCAFAPVRHVRCLLDSLARTRYEHTDETVVTFRDFDRRLADAYLRHDEPYDCAGSFKLEGAGFVLFDSVRTDDPTALIGLPMIWLAGRLLDLGYLRP